MKEVIVSICCLTYNHKEYIKKALDSFLMQKVDFDYEILIYDDASTDGTSDIIREYERIYPEKIRAVIQEENQYSKGISNPSGVFNFPRAKGKYIAFCEGDDYWTDENKLSKQYKIMEENKDISFCFHSAENKAITKTYINKLVRPYKFSSKISPEQVIDKSKAYPSASLFFRTEYVKNLPEYYFSCPVGDIPMQLIFASKGYGYYIDEVMSIYRIGGAYSWSELEKKGDYENKQKIYVEKMHNMYDAYNKETNYKFNTQVESAKKRIAYLSFVNTKKYEKIFDIDNKKYYKELQFSTRCLMILEYKLPKVYNLIRSLYKKI